MSTQLKNKSFEAYIFIYTSNSFYVFSTSVIKIIYVLSDILFLAVTVVTNLSALLSYYNL